MNFEEYKYKILDDNKNFIISNAKIKKKLKFSLSTTKHNIKRFCYNFKIFFKNNLSILFINLFNLKINSM